jgi:hypothetical protein
MVDELRKVDRPLRTEVLKYNLVEINKIVSEDVFYDPMQISAEPIYKIVRVLIEDCRVFRTKARAPSMIYYEVERVDEVVVSVPITIDTGSGSPPRGKNLKSPSYDEYEVGQILGSKYNQTLADLHEHERRIHQEASDDEATAVSEADSFEALSRTPDSPVADPASLLVSGSSVKTRRDSSVKSNGSLLSAHRKSVPFLSMLGIDLSSMPSGSSSSMPDSVLRDLSVKLELNTDQSVSDSDHGPVNTASSNQVSPVVILSAKKLLQAGKIDEREYNQLINSDARFRGEEVRDEVIRAQLHMETCFGELWEAKRERILGFVDPLGSDWPKKDLRCLIVKSNDDLRQEVCCLQIMELCNEIFVDNGLGGQLFLKPYRIVSTGADTGLVEVLPDTVSIDALKKVYIYDKKIYDKFYK